MRDIETVVQALCKVGAEAVSRYVTVSGDDTPSNMPEYFVPAYLLDRLGDELVVTLEGSFEGLFGWNERARHGAARSLQDSSELLLRPRQKLAGRRVDLVLAVRRSDGKSEEPPDLLALVECKRNWIDADKIPGKESDRDKLLLFLAHIDTCQWGIVCGGWIDQNHRAYQRDRSMKGTGDKWYECEIPLSGVPGGPFWFAARLFDRLSDDERLRYLAAMP